ncbi:hypothetical protein MTO98_28580 [Mucilaginibacter sp. SMC90]|uniref:Uncharacterized protein n=1 Tax=Mucilaginibacter rubeus TaxID=2027860 RepID=A0A5C1I805_9SPHI|nr:MULTISPECIES: hypothetical protein [Mucilaginibacter]QEM13994.1 hypothetical protein DEO27_029585 [Mucilaginibacter rubeus]UOE48369.1 hypothetical protein MTO98_28580 [Mucilaginibacter sp. SMC90]
MKQGFKVILFVMALGLMLIAREPVKAQCAQCAATVETNAQSGSSKTRGLNNGILFLLGAPYFAVALGGYIWYKKYRRKDVKLEMRPEKLNLN